MQSPSSAVNPSVLSTLLPSLHRAQAGAAAEVRDDDAPVGDLRRHLGSTDAMYSYDRPWKPYRCTPRVADLARQRHQLGDRRLAAMKAGVEAGDLRHVGQPLGDRFDRREVVRLMQRRQRNQRSQLVEHLRRRRSSGPRSAAPP